MNRDLLDAFGAITVSVSDEIHGCYPELLRAREAAEVGDEALVRGGCCSARRRCSC